MSSASAPEAEAKLPEQTGTDVGQASLLAGQAARAVQQHELNRCVRRAFRSGVPGQ